MTADERARLRALAVAATPGPWSAGVSDPEGLPNDTPTIFAPEMVDVVALAPVGDDAAFIAAANPAAVVALLDALDAAERRVAELEEREDGRDWRED